MLEEIRITALGVIAEATVELDSGLTVITGETGAGKTLLLQGLGLLLGGRADAGVVRSGADRAVVEGRLRIDRDSAAFAAIDELGGVVDDDVVIVSRTVSTDGRSRATVGGRAAPIGMLADLAESVVSVHGQSDQQRLLRPGHQRALLDRFGVASDLIASHRATYATWCELRDKIAALEKQVGTRAARIEQLRDDVERIESVGAHVGELEAIDLDLSRLVHAESLHSAATSAYLSLTGDPDGEGAGGDAISLLSAASKSLRQEIQADPSLQVWCDDLLKASEVVSDVAAELSRYRESLDADPLRVEALQSRKAVLTTLVRRYGKPLDEVLNYSAEARRELEDFEDDTLLPRLHQQCDEALAECVATARALHSARCAAAERLEADAGTELVGLAMPHARLMIRVAVRAQSGGVLVDEEEVALGPDGFDDVEILLAGHSGATARPLHKGASGGELSRVMLALEVALAGSDPVPTMVFDEVDAGVGGKAAIEVGARLARLSRRHQVLCVTHLPQVAAFADHHLVVRKSDDGAVTESGISLVAADERVEELSRMLAGLDESEHARAHAQELLDLAHQVREVRQQ